MKENFEKVTMRSAKIDIQQLVNRLKWDVYKVSPKVGKNEEVKKNLKKQVK